MFILSWSLFVVPWTATVASTAWLTNVVYSIIGICSSFLMIGKKHMSIILDVRNHLQNYLVLLFLINHIHLHILGGNIICLDFWGRRSGPFIYALHFSLSIGLLIGPFVIEPLSQTHVPQMVQNLALPKNTFQTNSSSSKEQFEKDTYHNHPYNHHTIIKRSISNLAIRNKSDIDKMDEKFFPKMLKPVTPDPLLVELFASTHSDIKM